MSGGRIVIHQPPTFTGKSFHTTLVGNTVAFGATGGKLFVHGRARQRLGVRNSGAVIVCEGAGQYACEYMTGGTAVFLGPVEDAIGAGMTDGKIFIYDPEGTQSIRYAIDEKSVAVTAPSDTELFGELLPLLDEYYNATHSSRAAEARQNLYQFAKLIPISAVVAEMRKKLAVDLGQSIVG
jgi:glutamate synthase domain-containing protein 3